MKKLFVILLLLLGVQFAAKAQFRQEAFSQNYADSTDKEKADSSKLFSFKEYFGGLAHKRRASLKTMFMGSTVFLGGEQIYNRQ